MPISLPPLEPLQGCDWAIQLLAGGRSNRSWLLSADDRRLVLRENAALPAVDRARERAVLQALSGSGLAPEVLASNTQHLLYRFVPGEPWDASFAAGEDGQRLAGNFMRRLHAHQVQGTTIDLTGAVRAMGGSPDGAAARLAGQVRALPRALCHMDLSPGNLIGPKPIAIDFEYAGMAPAGLDLAFYALACGRPLAELKTLLTAYGGAPPALETCALLAAELDRLWRLRADDEKAHHGEEPGHPQQ